MQFDWPGTPTLRRVWVVHSGHPPRTGSQRYTPSNMSVRRSARIANRQEEPLDWQKDAEVSAAEPNTKKSRHTKSSTPKSAPTSLQQEQQQAEKENLPAIVTAGADTLSDSKQPLQGSSTAPNKAVVAAGNKAAGIAAKGRKAASAAAAGPTRASEQALWAKGFKAVAGVDEAGRGPLAGPVVAAAAVLPADVEFPGLNDSKQMSEEGREELYEQLTNHPDVLWAVGVVDHEMIDEINILQAAMLAMQQAVEGLSRKPDHLLIDGNRRPKGLEHFPMQTLVKGDATSTCIAAASVIAKVTRDRMMLQLDLQYPQYGFAQHKGYGVPAHKAAIHKHGPCTVHRCSFEPVKSMTGWKGYGQKAAAAAATAAATQQQATSELANADELACDVLSVPAAAVQQDPVDTAAQHDSRRQQDTAQLQPAEQYKQHSQGERAAAAQEAGTSRRRRRRA